MLQISISNYWGWLMSPQALFVVVVTVMMRLSDQFYIPHFYGEGRCLEEMRHSTIFSLSRNTFIMSVKSPN